MATKIKLLQLEDGTSGQLIKVSALGVPTYVNQNTINLSAFNNDLGSGLTIGTSTITGGANTRILYNNSGVVGEYTLTGSGSVVAMATSPTFVTDITTPLIIGGTAVGSVIQYKGTTANGTSTVAAHQFLVGNNGSTQGAVLYNSGNFNIGNASNTTPRLLRIGQDTAWTDIGSLVGATSYSAIYFNTVTPSTTNYAIASDGLDMLLNAPGASGAISLRTANSIRLTVNRNGSGLALTNIDLLVGINTNQTLSTNIPSFRVTGASKQWATGALTTQYFNHFTANTVAFVGASTATNVYGLYVEAATAGTNATITNNYAAGFSGAIQVIGGGVKAAAGTTSYASLNIPHGSAPTSPVDGDIWTTTAGLYVRINGVTVGPLS